MVEQESVGGRHGGRIPAGVTGPAPVDDDARSRRGPCRRKPHAFGANDAPRGCGQPSIGDMPVVLPSDGGLHTVVLRRLRRHFDSFRHEGSERDAQGAALAHRGRQRSGASTRDRAETAVHAVCCPSSRR